MIQGLYTTTIIIGILMVAAFLIVRISRGGLPATFLKTGASICFILTAFSTLLCNAENFKYGTPIIAGLIFGMLGDIWLDMKYVYEQHNHIYTYAGIICFIINHVFFITAIMTKYTEIKWWFIVINIIAAIIFSVISIALEKAMKLDYGRYKKIIFLYGAFLSCTMFTAINGIVYNGFSKDFLIITIASVLFTLSDLVLSNIYFKEGGNTKLNIIVNHLLYYTAQFLFASTILF